jgi:DNA-binding CsgD family transcriptional regulator
MGQIAFPVLQAFSEKCLRATKPADITVAFNEVVREHGVTQWYIGALGFVDQWQGFGFDHVPEGWRQRYIEAEYAKCDPVFRHARAGGAKTTWSQCKRATFRNDADPHALKMFGEASEFGLTEGLIMPIHGYGDLPAAVSFGGDDLDLGDDAQSSLYLTGALAYEGLRRVVEKFKPVSPVLSEQELKVLRWTAEGKSASTISVILDLSPHTVREYQQNLRAKYKVSTMIQVVVQAALGGYLSPSLRA